MDLRFVIYMFLSNNPSSGDINSSNLSCFLSLKLLLMAMPNTHDRFLECWLSSCLTSSYRPYITQRLLMGHKELNQTNKSN